MKGHIIIQRGINRAGADPQGTAHRQSQRKLCEQEKPNNAMAVRVVEIAVTFAVPSLAMTFVLKRLEMTVPAEIIAEIKLAYEIGT